ncbi:hypothetical protein HDU97_006368 [Phlyctochytrium planicorne]|nr:hypothetical protein HDU97_006368 [Phlyctochytrium planicorne]
MRRFAVSAAQALLWLIVSVQAQTVNKTNVLKIGIVLPFGIPGVPVDYWAVLSAMSAESYNPIAWAVQKLNNQTDILPDTRLELIAATSAYDRGVSLTATQNLAAQGAVALIGEVASRNTVPTALGASITKMLHCNPFASTSVLSNKADYGYSFRTTNTITQYAAALLAVIKSQNVTNIAIMASDDEAGQSYIQEMAANCKAKGIVIKGFVTITPGKANYTDDWLAVLAFKTNTIVLISPVGDGGKVLTNGNSVGVFNGDYWIVGAPGFDAGQMVTPEQRSAILNMKGIWQVFGQQGTNADAKEFYDWWNDQFYPNGTMMVNSTGFSCDLTVPFARGCMGRGPGISGASPEFIKATQLNVPLTVEYWMYASLGCVRAFATTFDYYLKNKVVTVADIQAKKLLTSAAAGNISAYLNKVPIPDFWGKNYQFDKNGDAVLDVAILNWKWDTRRNGMWPLEVGYWQNKEDKVNFFSELVFSGNKTSAPQPPPVPTNQYQAKMSLRYAFDGIVAFCSFISLALAGAMIVYLKQKIFKASSPVFLALILLGANISFISIYLLSQYPMTSSSCITYGWLKYLGFAVVFGSLIVKTYRIFVIFTTKKKGKQNLSDGILMSYFLVLLTIWVIILLIWTIVPSQRPFLDSDVRYKLDDFGAVASVEVMPYCNFTSFNYVCLAAMVITLAVGVFLTYAVRDTPGAFNESQWMAYAIYNWVVIGIVLNAIANFAVSNPDIIFVMEALTVIITQTGVCILMIVPKLFVIRQGGGDSIETGFSAETGSGSKRQSVSAGGKSSNAASTVIDARENEKLLKEIAELKKQVEKQQVKIDGLTADLNAAKSAA